MRIAYVETIGKALSGETTTGRSSSTLYYLEVQRSLSDYLMTTLIARYHSCDPGSVCHGSIFCHF